MLLVSLWNQHKKLRHTFLKQQKMVSKLNQKSYNQREAPKVAATEDAQPKGSLPPGTVVGDGKIKFVLARIDSRLLHGQVATAWTKATQPNRIIVVSDAVAKDDLRKKLIEQAAPPGVKPMLFQSVK